MNFIGQIGQIMPTKNDWDIDRTLARSIKDKLYIFRSSQSGSNLQNILNDLCASIERCV